MKKYLFAYLIVALSVLNACKKNDPEEDTTASGGGTLTAANYGVDGGAAAKFTSNKVGITQTTVNGVNLFTVSAIKDGSNESITIVVPRKIAGTGKVTFAYNDQSSGITYAKDYTKPGDLTLNYSTAGFNSTTKGGGELNITKLDGNKIEGTFYFIAINSAGKEAWAENGSFSGTIK